MSKHSLSTLLLIIAILGVASAVATLLPVTSLANPTLGGYNSWCPFAPVSTILLLIIAGLAWVVRQYIRTRLSG